MIGLEIEYYHFRPMFLSKFSRQNFKRENIHFNN